MSCMHVVRRNGSSFQKQCSKLSWKHARLRKLNMVARNYDVSCGLQGQAVTSPHLFPVLKLVFFQFPPCFFL